MKLEVPVQNCIAVKLVDLNLSVVAVYRPPSNSVQENTDFIQYLSDICSENEVLVMGDFNLPSLLWNQSPAPVAGVDKLFLFAFLTLGLTQWVTEATFPHSGNILDLILTTDDDRIGTVVLTPTARMYHCPTLCEYLLDFITLLAAPQVKVLKRWHHSRCDHISRCLAEVYGDFQFMPLDANGAYNRFLILSPHSSMNMLPQAIHYPSAMHLRT